MLDVSIRLATTLFYVERLDALPRLLDIARYNVFRVGSSDKEVFYV